MIVAVIPNLDKHGSSEMVDKIGLLFKQCGIEAYLPDNVCCPHYSNMNEDELFKTADIIITIGGDGTIIRYAKRAANDNKPILGINAGRMGYLANVEQGEYRLLENLKDNNYSVENRLLMKIVVKENGNIVGQYEALNDAVVTSGYISRIIDITATVDGDNIKYRADGLISSTPTGSTAYSMAAGGPIIDPTMDCFCLTPICSHMLSAKPMLICGNKTIKLKAFSKKRAEIYLSVDGRKVTNIKPFTEIYISKSEKTVKLIRLDNKSFFKTLSAKFSDVRSAGVEK